MVALLTLNYRSMYFLILNLLYNLKDTKVYMCSRAGAANGKEPTGAAETVIQGDGVLQGHQVRTVCVFRV